MDLRVSFEGGGGVEEGEDGEEGERESEVAAKVGVFCGDGGVMGGEVLIAFPDGDEDAGGGAEDAEGGDAEPES